MRLLHGRYHSAVWSGSEMIIWGGASSSVTVLDTGARYNPNTDTVATTSVNAPAARRYHSAIWSGS